LSHLYTQIFGESPFNMSSLKIAFYKAVGTLCSCNFVLSFPYAV